ncbi:Hypothetical protein CINCED_3A022440 [Cinara cedri]|uniref:Uncharacterized protein n=1 Tax=Cinara cedri TaxID=506608 RepID=A0A5E4M9E0_9HEMI|nr:Hypothetical protein CINCED_3A022440 [Cinara cedri]
MDLGSINIGDIPIPPMTEDSISLPFYMLSLSEQGELQRQIVWGVKDNAIKNKLLAKANLTYTDIVEIASSMEIVQKDLVEFSHASSKELNFIKNKGPRKKDTLGRLAKKIIDDQKPEERKCIRQSISCCKTILGDSQ